MKMQIVGVIFNDTASKYYQRVYDFKSFDESLTVNDLVVVDTCNGFGIGRIARIMPDYSEANLKKATKEVICKVDTTAWNNRKLKAEKLASLKRQMDKHVAKMQANAMYEICAAGDPEMKALLDTYKALTDE